MPAQRIPIINYHKIEDRSDFGITTRKISDFKRDLDMLCYQGFETVDFNDVSMASLPSRPIMITFDDGYTSFINHAMPALLERGMKAVVYIPTDFIGKANNWDVHIGRFKYKHMDRHQISSINTAGMEIGSHGCSHRFLNILPLTTLENELKKSKMLLEKMINKNVLSISYPFGRANQRVLRMVQKFYTYGVALNQKTEKDTVYNRLLLNRLNIYRTDSQKRFLRKVQAAEDNRLIWFDQLIQQGSWATIALQKFQRIKIK